MFIMITYKDSITTIVADKLVRFNRYIIIDTAFKAIVDIEDKYASTLVFKLKAIEIAYGSRHLNISRNMAKLLIYMSINNSICLNKLYIKNQFESYFPDDKYADCVIRHIERLTNKKIS